MRTTLDIDDEVLELARILAAQQKQSIGKVISEVFKRNAGPDYQIVIKNGVRVFQRSNPEKVVNLEMVNKLRDEG